MKKIFSVFILTCVFLTAQSRLSIPSEIMIAEGRQPQVAVDNMGTIRIVFGQGDKIFCTTSANNGTTFSPPVLVAEVPSMHLGMWRGPQLASSATCCVITAMDKSGDIHWFRLDHGSATWKSMGIVNDVKGTAPEGLMGLAADKSDNFYAVWLDIRTGKHNQIYFADLAGKAGHWSNNRLLYQSPDEHVCECCKPGIAVQGTEVAVMFRNWLKGSRDLYTMKSFNSGKSFSPAEKLGLDTWKLDGCPMDGGGIAIDPTAVVKSSWQRKGVVYYCQAGLPEVYIGQGRSCSIFTDGNESVITYQTSDTLKLVTLKDKKTRVVGTGSFLKAVALAHNKIFCVWEQDNKIKCKEM